MSRMETGPTDLQLEAIVRHLAKTHLEIERGVRDPAQLTRLMSPQAEHLWQQTRQRGRPLPGGPVRDADLGPVHLRAQSDGQTLATVTTPTQHGRWGALTFVLQTEGRTVSIRQAKRLHAGLDYGRSIAYSDDPPVDRLDRAMEERRIVLAALEAAQPATPQGASGGADPNADAWRKVLAELDTEIMNLMQTDLNRHFAVEAPARRT